MHRDVTGEAGDNPALPALWFYGFLRALPGDEFLLSPSLRELTAIIDPVGSIIASAKLDCSNGSQNYTISPYGSLAPFVLRAA